MVVGITEGGENFSAYSEIWMLHVRRLHCFRKTQREFAKIIWCHCLSLGQSIELELSAIKEQRHVERVMLGYPRNELRVRKDQPDDSQREM